MESMINPFEGLLNEMWFILTILILFSLVPLWRFVCRKKLYETIAFVALLFVHFYYPSSNLLCVRQVCTYSIFFFSGILIYKYNVEDIGKNYKWWLVMLGAVLYLCSFFFFN